MSSSLALRQAIAPVGEFDMARVLQSSEIAQSLEFFGPSGRFRWRVCSSSTRNKIKHTEAVPNSFYPTRLRSQVRLELKSGQTSKQLPPNSDASAKTKGPRMQWEQPARRFRRVISRKFARFFQAGASSITRRRFKRRLERASHKPWPCSPSGVGQMFAENNQDDDNNKGTHRDN